MIIHKHIINLIIMMSIGACTVGDNYVDGGRACTVQANYWCGGPGAPRAHMVGGAAGTACFYAYVSMCPAGAYVAEEDHEACMRAMSSAVLDDLPRVCTEMWRR